MTPYFGEEVDSYLPADANHLLDVSTGNAAFELADKTRRAFARLRELHLGQPQLLPPLANNGPQVLSVPKLAVHIARLRGNPEFHDRSLSNKKSSQTGRYHIFLGFSSRLGRFRSQKSAEPPLGKGWLRARKARFADRLWLAPRHLQLRPGCPRRLLGRLRLSPGRSQCRPRPPLTTAAPAFRAARQCAPAFSVRAAAC